MFIDERQATNPAAKQVLAILEAGSYEAASGTQVPIASAQASACEGTRLYTPDRLDALRDEPPDQRPDSALPATGPGPRVEVIDATTQVAAQDLAKEVKQGSAVLLNFASARNPGGGFLGGAKAQEEELCRCSGLYRTLLTQPEYYRVNRANRSLLYADHIIYSPAVPFFRTATKAPLLDDPYLPSVITAPAPNAGAIERNQPGAGADIEATFERRWGNVLAVAAHNGHRTVLLGAWGCGAFRNDPVMAASTARRALAEPRFADAFDHIVFAIPGFGKRSKGNLEAFTRVFGGAG